MVTNVNFPAPLQVLAFLGTVFALVLCLATAIYSALARRAWMKPVLLIAGAILATYTVLLLVFSFASGNRVLANGQDKHFCEIDCHVAYAVLGTTEKAAPAAQKLWTVQLRTRFDETTISSTRAKDMPLTPNPRRIELLADDGRRYQPVEVSAPAKRFGDPLKPGESYENAISFLVPVGVHHAKLLLIATAGPEQLLIGSESSPFHGKTYFDVQPQTTN